MGMDGNDNNPATIFPLPLVPFEEYMFADDRPAYPMNFFARFRFSGRFDRDALDGALQTVVARHPLLGAQLQEDKRGRWCWVGASGGPPRAQWLDAPPAGGYPHCSAIDLRQETGLRLFGLAGEDSDDLLFQFHHSCCDGLSALQLIEEVLVAYALALGTAPRRAALRPLQTRRLLGRGSFHLTLWRLLRMLPAQATGLLGARQFLMRRPVPVIPHQAGDPDGPVSEAYPAALTRQLDEDQSAALRTAARRRRASVNDLLARDLFLALASWRTKHQWAAPDEWLRLSVPMNLRTVPDRHMPAANVVSMVFLDRRDRDFADGDALLAGIHDEMRLIIRRQLGLTLHLSLLAFRWLPGGLQRQIRADRCTASCVFTNLGTAMGRTPLSRQNGQIVAGNVTLAGMDLLAPIRPLTAAAMAVFTYARRACFTLHYDGRVMMPDQAADLLDTYVQQVQESIVGGGL